MKLVTGAQMRKLEQRAVEAGTSVDELMEQAGLAVAQEVWLVLGAVDGRRILVLVGPGNNGGDGLVAARHLAEWGADVVLYIVAGRPERDPHMETVRAQGVRAFDAARAEDRESLQEAVDGAEVIVDGVLGIGSNRPIDGEAARALMCVRAARERAAPPKIIAIDIPSGVDTDSGLADPHAVAADLTVTFGCAKAGLYTLPGSELAGRVQVIDIGIPAEAMRDLPVELLDTRWVRERLPARAKDGNKGTFGRVLVFAGSAAYPGAARLSAEACYRAGAGLVTLACTRDVQPIVASAAPEIVYRLLDDSASAARTVLDAIERNNVLLIGPGLGTAPPIAAAVADVMAGMTSSVEACVIDADGLNVLKDGWPASAARPCIVTPHPGEMARLLDREIADVQTDRLNVALRAAQEWGHVVVLKGAHTVVAAPDGRAAVSPFANPLLATAGTGDVLAGTIAGLVGQGMPPFEAAACGVYVHGLAADELAEELGDRGLLASELLPAIPRAIRTIREGKRQPPVSFGGLFGGVPEQPGGTGMDAFAG